MSKTVSGEENLALAVVYAERARAVAGLAVDNIAYGVTGGPGHFPGVRYLRCKIQEAQALLAECARILREEDERSLNDCEFCYGIGTIDDEDMETRFVQTRGCSLCKGTGQQPLDEDLPKWHPRAKV